jgi:hypothetical protein
MAASAWVAKYCWIASGSANGDGYGRPATAAPPPTPATSSAVETRASTPSGGPVGARSVVLFPGRFIGASSSASTIR